jgi:mannose-6-phosphate isomerase-like protein (cupin superfamily)
MAGVASNGQSYFPSGADAGGAHAEDDFTGIVRVTGNETGGRFMLVEASVPPHYPGRGLISHPKAAVLFYVIRGELAFTLDHETRIVRPGAVVLVQPGTEYGFWNPTPAPANYLAYTTPADL